MINCLKCAQQCQLGIFKKMCRATTVPYSVMWVSPQFVVNQNYSEYIIEINL